MNSNVKISTMISYKHCVYFQIIEVILKDALQRSDIHIINLLLFFDIIENNIAKSLRIFSSFMTVGPGLHVPKYFVYIFGKGPMADQGLRKGRGHVEVIVTLLVSYYLQCQ